MFLWLYLQFASSLEGGRLGFLRLLNSVPFRTLASVLTSFAIVLGLGSPVIGWLRRRKIGDNPDFDRADMNAIMAEKRGTPTMGGLLIVGSIALTTLLLGDVRNAYVLLALATLTCLACLGAIDDWIKLNRHRRAAAGTGVATRQGLTGRQKLIVQVTFGAIVSWLTLRLGDHSPHATRLYFPLFKEETGVWLALPTWLFVCWGAFILTGASNSVNLTDGLDGLASGCTAFVAFTLVVFGIVVGDVELARMLLYPSMPGASQLAPVAAAIGGACLGFLWFNAHPARVFMGDTGSLALGGLLGYVALVLRQEVLLGLVGAVFVAEALSVMLQVYYFKYTRIRLRRGASHLPHEPAAPSLPEARLERVAGGRALLARRRDARDRGTGDASPAVSGRAQAAASARPISRGCRRRSSPSGLPTCSRCACSRCSRSAC